MELHIQEMKAFVRSTEIGKKLSPTPLEGKVVHVMIMKKEAMN